VYGVRAPGSREGAVLHLPFDARGYDPDETCHLQTVDGHARWARVGSPPDRFDPVAATARLLALSDEAQVAEADRDALGTFAAAALPPALQAALEVPLVEAHAAGLLARLERAAPGISRDAWPRWPGRRRYAVALTHDVDAVHLGSPLEVATNLAKAVLRRDLVSARLAALGCLTATRPAVDPFFAFDAWRPLEERWNAKSAFYLFHRAAGVPAALNDAKSHVGNTRVPWAVLRALADDGWEFGLHPSLNARRVPGAFGASRRWLSERMGRELTGLRHHYYAFDWRAPHRTFREHTAGGFLYDASLAWRDRSGFRGGSCLPFAPFDADRGRAIELTLLPTALMDGHVAHAETRRRRAYLDDPAREARAARLVDVVRTTGGLLVLNWHQETVSEVGHLQGVVARLERLLAPLLGDSDAWFATPAEIARHWRTRSAGLAQLAASDGGPPRV
jgi:hypothetical protein